MLLLYNLVYYFSPFLYPSQRKEVKENMIIFESMVISSMPVTLSRRSRGQKSGKLKGPIFKNIK